MNAYISANSIVLMNGIFMEYTGDTEVQYLIYSSTTCKEKFWPLFPSQCDKWTIDFCQLKSVQAYKTSSRPTHTVIPVNSLPRVYSVRVTLILTCLGGFSKMILF